MIIPDIRFVSIEEFIPIGSVDSMLGVAESLLTLVPQQRIDAAENLKRSMVWMKKYIAPTSEFWDWETFQHSIDHRLDLRVSFIGLGWLVGLVRKLDGTDEVDLGVVDRDLCKRLDEITVSVPVEAVGRMKASPWKTTDVKELAGFLRANHHRFNVRGSRYLDFETGVTLELSDHETITALRLSSGLDSQLRAILVDIKRWANQARKFEGADWCAYKRRRLTTIVGPMTGDDLAPDKVDFQFTDEPSGLYKRSASHSFDIVSEGDNQICAVIFPDYPFHTGLINPRMSVRTARNASEDVVDEVLRYYSYLWVNHYTRLWRYLEFEDQFTYTSNVRRLKELDDRALFKYPSRMLEADELRTSIELANRIDEGELSAYSPPHARFDVEPGIPGEATGASRLRQTLIPSTVTKLRRDPLKQAPSVLREATEELTRSYTIFSETASLRMQRGIQILQLVFVVAAAAQVLTLIPIAAVLEEVTKFLVGGSGPYRTLLGWKNSISWLRKADLMLYTWQVILLVGLSVASLALLRRHRWTQLIRRFLE